MKVLYLVDYVFYDAKRASILENRDYVMGNCMCPSNANNEHWSFRLWPKLRKLQFLMDSGPLLHVNETMELLEGHRAFGHILVKDIVYEDH